VRIDGSNTGNFRNEQDIFFEEGAGSALMQTNGDLDITSFAFVDPDFDLESVGTNREIIDDDAARSITGDGGDNAINAAGGADTIDGGGGSDTILGGSEVDTINLGAPGDRDVLSVADFDVDGKDRDVVTNFESGSAGDVYNIEAASGGSVTGTTLSGTDNFTTTNSIQTASSPGVTYLASTEVLLFEGADLAGDLSASPGANVLNGNGALAATGGIDVASDGDTVLFAIGDTAGNTAIYLIDERPLGTVSVQEDEMTLIGVLEDVAVNSLIVDNFSNMDLF
jgi:hypothetical protein